MNKVVKLSPVVKSYIWGGQYFQKFGKSDLDVVSELWELSVRNNEKSIIASGEEQGKALKDIIFEQDIGERGKEFPYFPLLIKLIDAKENLSVQVHPSDDYALKYENSFGKCEMWYIIDAEEGAGLYVGLNKDYSKQELEEKLNNGTLLEAMNFFKVKPGDYFIITPGTMHAIGKGVRLLEIQQNSDLTYRLYDYNRVDKNGCPRELHIKKGLEVIDLHRFEPVKGEAGYIAKNKYFTVKEVEVKDELELIADKFSFKSFTIIDGEGMVDNIPFKRFDTFFLPSNQKCRIKGKATIVISSI